MLPDGDDNSKALLQLFAGLICQSPQLATTAAQLCTTLLAGPMYNMAEHAMFFSPLAVPQATAPTTRAPFGPHPTRQHSVL